MCQSNLVKVLFYPRVDFALYLNGFSTNYWHWCYEETKKETGLTLGDLGFMWLGREHPAGPGYREPEELSCFSHHIVQVLSWCSAKRKFSALVIGSKGMLICVEPTTTTLYRNVLWSNTQKTPRQEGETAAKSLRARWWFCRTARSRPGCREIQNSQGRLWCDLGHLENSK